MNPNNTQNRWAFADPKNVAVFTTKQVMRLGRPILHVSHDKDDGAWQFHTGTEQLSPSDAMIVALSEIVERDQSISELADLPCGWHADRDAVGKPWRRTER